MAINRYLWKGINQTGKHLSGILEANTIVLAKAELRKKGIIIRKIRVKRTFLFSRMDPRHIKSSDINLFTRQLATLNNAGVPLVQALQIIGTGEIKPSMKQLIQTIQTNIKTGLMLAQALRKHPAFFNAFFCSMIDAGEQSGSLDVMLLKIAEYKEQMTRFRQKIGKILTYPFAVIIIAIIVTGGLLTWVVPQFDSLFKNFNAELPLLTQCVIHLSMYLKSWGLFILSLSAAIVYGGLITYKHSATFSKFTHQCLLQFPIIGVNARKIAISRFTRTLSITIAAGLPLTAALSAAADITGNLLYAQAICKIKNDISQGQSMYHAVATTGLFPEMTLQLLSIGEESGTLEHMLDKIADIYEEDIDMFINTFSDLLEPVIMTILGLFIGGLVVAMYLPILQLGSII